jgi:hypothetical protein
MLRKKVNYFDDHDSITDVLQALKALHSEWKFSEHATPELLQLRDAMRQSAKLPFKSAKATRLDSLLRSLQMDIDS